MTRFVSRFLPLVAAVATLAACGRDATSPDAARTLSPSAPAALLGPNESVRTISDTTDAFGNTTTVSEYAAGTYTLPNGDGASIGSVTIRTVIPATFSSSKSCITSSIVGVGAVTGWTSSIKKSGGCNQEIGVQFENRSTKQRVDFSFLMQPGKTRIDFGAVR